MASLDLSDEWKALIEKLWESDDLSLSDLLGEIAGAVKSSKSNSMAERALLLLLHSPKVHRLPALVKPANVLPEREAVTSMVDDARHPRGTVDAIEAGLRVAVAVHGGLAASTIMDALNVLPGKETDEASAQRAKRGRQKLGTPRKIGRPKKTVAP